MSSIREQVEQIVRDFAESWSVSDEAAKALTDTVTHAIAQQAEDDALIAESFEYSTAAKPHRYIARAIRRKAGILKQRKESRSHDSKTNQEQKTEVATGEDSPSCYALGGHDLC